MSWRSKGKQMKEEIKCPCGKDGTLFFVGSTTKADQYGSATQLSWCHLDHYFYFVVRAPFVTHGHRGSSYEITMTDPGLASWNRSNHDPNAKP